MNHLKDGSDVPRLMFFSARSHSDEAIAIPETGMAPIMPFMNALGGAKEETACIASMLLTKPDSMVWNKLRLVSKCHSAIRISYVP